MKRGIKPLFLKQLNKKVNLSPAKSLCLKIETGKNYPTSENLQKIADALCVEVHELFEFDEDKNSILLDKIYKRIEVHKNNKQKLVELYKILQALD